MGPLEGLSKLSGGGGWMGIMVYALECLKLPPCGSSARGTLTLITTLN